MLQHLTHICGKSTSKYVCYIMYNIQDELQNLLTDSPHLSVHENRLPFCFQSICFHLHKLVLKYGKTFVSMHFVWLVYQLLVHYVDFNFLPVNWPAEVKGLTY